MSEQSEPFLARWSRLKREARDEQQADAAETPREVATAREEPAAAATTPAPPAAAPPAGAPALPPIEQLTPESDFRPFMAGGVPPQTRAAALRKLFADPHFNVPDPFEVHSQDYTSAETIPPAMLKTLQHARRLLFDESAQTAASARQSEEREAAGSQDSGGAIAARATDARAGLPSGTSDGAVGQDA